MSAEAYGLPDSPTEHAGGDFRLSPDELAKGEQAAATYLSSMKTNEARRGAEDALDILAAVISGGVCGGKRFPWHQVRAYHGALAISIIKEKGAPAHIEALRCRHDEKRRYQQVSESFKTKDVQRMRATLSGVLEECWNLGFISDDEMDLAVRPPNRQNNRQNNRQTNRQTKGGSAKKVVRERELTDGEVRAMLASCDMDCTVAGTRDALMLGLAWHAGLKTVDLINLTLDAVGFDQKTGRSTLLHKAPGAKRKRVIPLKNEDLIRLEDWLEARGREPGPLFCPTHRGHIELKRMSATVVREFCDQRAEQAGVVPFTPNDLARCSPYAAHEAAQRRRPVGQAGGTAQQRPMQPVSPLYEDLTPIDPIEDEVERISFPYEARVRR